MSTTPPHLALPKGMHDHLPDASGLIRDVEDAWIHHASGWGHQLVLVPPVGMAATFNHGHGAADERTYDFLDRKGRQLSLVPDSLTAIAAALARSGKTEARASFSCSVFRYRHHHRRYFHQTGAMLLYPPAAGIHVESYAVAELLDMAAAFLAPRLPVRVKLGDIGVWRAALQDTPPETIHELSKIAPADRPGWLATRASPAAIGLAAALAADPTGATAPDPTGRIGLLREMARTRFAKGLDVSVDLGDFHACEHHSGVGFQLVGSSDGGRIGDGGVYSDLATKLFGRQVVLLSVAFGLEEVAARHAARETAATSDVVVRMGRNPAAVREAHALADDLRALGLRVYAGPAGRDIARDIRKAEAECIPWLLHVGDHEVESGDVRIRSTSSGVSAELVRLVDVVDWFTLRLRPAGTKLR